MSETFQLDTKELDRIATGLHKKREEIGVAIAFEIEGQAKIKAPYLTGALSNSIYTVTKESDGYHAANAAVEGRNPGVRTQAHPQPKGNIIANVGPCVEYAEYLELGTSRMEAKPYLLPVIESISRAINNGKYFKRLFTK